MADPVVIIDAPVDHKPLQEFCVNLWQQQNQPLQIALQKHEGITGNDWQSGVGTCDNPHTYCVLNPLLEHTVVEETVALFPEYYRWRLLALEPRRTYSVHRDLRRGCTANTRIHIPILTSPHAHLQFWDSYPSTGTHTVLVRVLELGSTYRVDTSLLHTAVNLGSQTRLHLVGEQDTVNGN